MDVYANFAYCTLTAGVAAADTVLVVDSTARVPDPSLGDVWLAFDSTLSAGNFEIVKVLSKTPTTLTVLRGQEGTPVPSAISNGTVMRGTLTAAMLERLRPARQDVVYTTALLAPGAQSVGTVALGRSYRLMRIQTDRQSRVRLYDRAAKQTADAARPLDQDPVGDHGLVFEFIAVTGALSAGLTPLVDGTDWDMNPDRLIPITVDNLEGDPRIVTVTLTFLRTEP